jgi:hypothetical protein
LAPSLSARWAGWFISSSSGRTLLTIRLSNLPASTRSRRGHLGHHEVVADSLRSDPRRLRAARRAVFPSVSTRRPGPGRIHPASAADVRDALRIFGEEIYYGVDKVELVPAPPSHGRLPLGRLAGPGRIMLFDQPLPPWRLGYVLTATERARLCEAGADIAEDGVVHWPGETLRRFMLGHVLAHELGHHVLQHERRLRGERGARTRDHEARAEAVAAQLRALLA